MKIEKLICQRVKCIGTLESYRRPHQNRYNRKRHRIVTFKNIHINGELFRDHCHVIVPKGIWNILHNDYPEPFGKTYSFTAELHRYTRTPNIKRGEIGRTNGIGLRDIAKIKNWKEM